MKAELTKQRITWLPVHDAELIFLKVTPRANGDVSLSVAAKLHKDEPMDELFKLGLKTRSFRLTFENSWQIVFNILAVAGGKETIDDCRVVGDSELLSRLLSLGFAQSNELKHYRIGFSSGSSIDVVAKGVFIEEFETERGRKGVGAD